MAKPIIRASLGVLCAIVPVWALVGCSASTAGDPEAVGVAAQAEDADELAHEITRPWPVFGHDAAHTNFNGDENNFFKANNVGGLKVAWKNHYGDNVITEGGPVEANGLVYVAGADGALSAFAAGGCGKATCEPLWQGLTDNDITSTPAVAGGLVFIGSADHFLYAFPALGCGKATCKPIWKAELADAVVDSSVAFADGVVYVGDFSGKLYAFLALGCGKATCKPLWIGQGTTDEAITSAPAVGHGSVFVGSTINSPTDFTGRLLVFPAAGCGKAVCAPSWTGDINGPASFTASPVVSGNTVYMGSATRFGPDNPSPLHLFAFSANGCGAKTCKPLRAYDVGEEGITTTPAITGNTLLVSTQNTSDFSLIGVVAAFDANGCGKAAVCEPLWTGVNAFSGFESSPAVAGDVVFVGKGPASSDDPADAGLYAFNKKGCGAAFCDPISFTQLSPSQVFLGAPVAIAGDKILMASADTSATDPATGDSIEASNVYVLSLPSSSGGDDGDD